MKVLLGSVAQNLGRKPVMVVLPFLSLVGPLTAMYFTGSPFVMAFLFFIGWAVNGTFPIFMATIPSETVDARHHATVLGLAMGAGIVSAAGTLIPPLLKGSDSIPPLAGRYPTYLVRQLVAFKGERVHRAELFQQK